MEAHFLVQLSKKKLAEITLKNLSRKIEDIILQHGTRGMNRLRQCMEPGYVYRLRK